jgi:hypothetical protein
MGQIQFSPAQDTGPQSIVMSTMQWGETLLASLVIQGRNPKMLVRTIARALLAAAASACVAGAVMAAAVPGAPTVYQNALFKPCPAAAPATRCYLVFPKVPANKVLRLTNINCNVYSNATNMLVILFTGPAIPQPDQWLNVFSRTAANGVFNLNEATFTHIPARTIPKILADPGVSEGVELFCSLSGQLINAQ